VVVRTRRDFAPSGRGDHMRCCDPEAAESARRPLHNGRVVDDDGRGLAPEVMLEVDEDPIPKRTSVNLDSVENVGIGTLTERLDRLGDARMREVCSALAIAVDCGS